MLQDEDRNEYVYWLKRDKLPEDEDEIDWAIEEAKNFTNQKACRKFLKIRMILTKSHTRQRMNHSHDIALSLPSYLKAKRPERTML